MTRLSFSAKFFSSFLKRFYKDIHIFKGFFLSVLTPKSCVERITKTENDKQLPKFFQIVGAYRDITVFTKLIRNFKCLYGSGRRCLRTIFQDS